jgi:hypothetical protein
MKEATSTSMDFSHLHAGSKSSMAICRSFFLI